MDALAPRRPNVSRLPCIVRDMYVRPIRACQSQTASSDGQYAEKKTPNPITPNSVPVSWLTHPWVMKCRQGRFEGRQSARTCHGLAAHPPPN